MWGLLYTGKAEQAACRLWLELFSGCELEQLWSIFVSKAAWIVARMGRPHIYQFVFYVFYTHKSSNLQHNHKELYEEFEVMSWKTIHRSMSLKQSLENLQHLILMNHIAISSIITYRVYSYKALTAVFIMMEV